MKKGLLWYDDNAGRDLAEKIRAAIPRYRRKFGVEPELCFVHPSMLLGGNGKVKQVDGVRVSSKPSVLRHHFWIGREERKRGRNGYG